MSDKEAEKAFIMDRVVKGEMSAAEGARRLSVSKRHVFRLKAGIKAKGIASLVHGNRQRKAANALPEEIRRVVRDRGTNEYRGASYSHISELLKRNEDVHISGKSVGRILKENGVKNPHTHKAPKKHRSRARRKRFGELVQVDASPFDWLGRGEAYSLHGAIDDATGRVLSLRLEKNECSGGYFHVLEDILKQWGVPGAIYSDRHTIFFSPKTEKLTEDDEIEGRKAPLTRYGLPLHLLGIEHIAARSPQAKGRIERLWGTCQRRLVVEMRIAGIGTIEEANVFLPGYLERHNTLFARDAAEKATAFLPPPAPEKLRLLLGSRDERKASAGSEISWKGGKYQLTDSGGRIVLLGKKEVVTVICTLDGSLYALRRCEGNGPVYGLIPSCRTEENVKDDGKNPDKATTPEVATPLKPAKDHPWRGTWMKRSPGRGIYDDPNPLEESAADLMDIIYGVKIS